MHLKGHDQESKTKMPEWDKMFLRITYLINNLYLEIYKELLQLNNNMTNIPIFLMGKESEYTHFQRHYANSQ